MAVTGDAVGVSVGDLVRSADGTFVGAGDDDRGWDILDNCDGLNFNGGILSASSVPSLAGH